MTLKHRIKAALIAFVFGLVLAVVGAVILICSGQSWWWGLVALVLGGGLGPIVGFLVPRPVLVVSRNIDIEFEV
ncbi:MAG: hypothetical protein AAF911_05870 [Planctomycetota bacterium]